jgi:GNAT superfamily N-acetyltransferase
MAVTFPHLVCLETRRDRPAVRDTALKMEQKTLTTAPPPPGGIRYTDDLSSVGPDMLGGGFFAGWPRRPTPAQHLAVLRGSHRAMVAVDDGRGLVAGFVNMISDGVLTAFIPWLEVLGEYQGQGIGGELMRRILDGTERFYSVDLVCDPELVPYYARFGMRAASSAALRHPAALAAGCPVPRPAAKRACQAGRNRSADQVSSMATWRTGWMPSSASAAARMSRLRSVPSLPAFG